MEGRPAPARGPSLGFALPTSPDGGFVELDGEKHYRIAAYHRMTPFLMSIASDTDLWMFIASGGGLTAGRVDAEGSLFPYRTVDQLHEAHHHSGPVTLLHIESGGGAPVLWEPFAQAATENPLIERNLFKNITGSRLVFEEVNHELQVAFRYCWSACDEFGWVRTATLTNRSGAARQISLLDGLRNILPHGAPLAMYQQSSNLVDAYKKSEIDPETGLGIFSLTAGITDRAEALEVLRANTVWCCGLEGCRVHLSNEALADFKYGRVVSEESLLNGAAGNYLVSGRLHLDPGENSSWRLIADCSRDHVQIADLRRRIRQDNKLGDRIDESLRQSGENLVQNVGSADGIQLSGRPESWTHHFANVLFNNMRGGVFAKNHEVFVDDFAEFLEVRNREVTVRHRNLLAEWPEVMTVQELRDAARRTQDPDLLRLGLEYLPLHFGRRHGDPSRPWNRFSIKVRDRHGDRELNYEGNWRDIFQNWEALCVSFPGFLPNIVAKFVNASTVDGFNPYRITRDGVDWEAVTPDDPWSNIGYWGDHQIIYLLKLLEALDQHDPLALGEMLGEEIFSYAEVPYRIKPYRDILRNPSDTIEFDDRLEDLIEKRVAGLGTDGKLLTGTDGYVFYANLLEKLLVPALSKLSNLIPDAGIWMNTQRPEWNDANNALAGGGVSVVTLCYLRRYLTFLARLLDKTAEEELAVSTEVAEWFGRIESVLEKEVPLLSTEELDPRDRKNLMDLLGGAFSDYRDRVYAYGFSGKTTLAVGRAADLCRTALAFVDRSIGSNRRDDGLYHTYNLLDIAEESNSVGVVHLQKMLEGQVAVLSSGMLEPAAALGVLERLFASDLYRADQRSFMLYPERILPGFLAKNTIPDAAVATIPLLNALLEAGNQDLLSRDADGVCRFQGDLRNGDELAAVLDNLADRSEWSALAASDRTSILDLFEDVFQHQSYTGRSGVMYAYEGLGCIYWHMVAKLLLAVQEMVLRARREGLPRTLQDDLAGMYFRVRAGIGYEKSVAEYGAFPTDPYSHTPPGGGAKQPGMTGQVKEEILTRFGELGVRVKDGAVRFQPVLLRHEEVLEESAKFHYFDVEGRSRMIPLSPGNLAFTYCQVPVIYERVASKAWINVQFADGTSAEHPGNLLDARTGAEIFARGGKVDLIRVGIPEEGFCKRN